MWIVFSSPRLGMGELFFGGDVEKGFEHLLAPLGLDSKRYGRGPKAFACRSSIAIANTDDRLLHADRQGRALFGTAASPWLSGGTAPSSSRRAAQ